MNIMSERSDNLPTNNYTEKPKSSIEEEIDWEILDEDVPTNPKRFSLEQFPGYPDNFTIEELNLLITPMTNKLKIVFFGSLFK